jgi:para-aminobenzoate synthetase/4-amino-4-deoxychorismate lyase
MFAPGTVLLHDTLSPSGRNLLFENPIEVLSAWGAEAARQALVRLESVSSEGLWAAGFLSYELGYLFEERLEARLGKSSATPLLWLGLYKGQRQLTPEEAEALLLAAAGGQPGRVLEVIPRVDLATYSQQFGRVQELIAAGDTYQVNLTFKSGFRLEGSPVALYRELVRQQPVAYGALINTGEQWVLSRSPELFVASEGGKLSARPMKGTLKRGATEAQDMASRRALAADEKNRAENLMIVDLLRNDLGRIAEVASVKVTDLFTVETYPTLHTMTSGITARRKPGIGTTDLLANLFPCGSITGAPKLRAMEIIADLEAEPRGVYTGSIGYFAPGGDLMLNVAIRTAVIDKNGMGEIGIGGGIVADSLVEDEYREALLKMAFFSDSGPITLIETLLWEPGQEFALLDRHLERLAGSAAHFGLPFDRAEIELELAKAAADYTSTRMRVRLTLGIDGIVVTGTELPPNPPVFRFALAPDRLASDSVWLRHKTTNRAFYDGPRQQAHAELGVDEVVFLNERDEVTEGSITSLFVERDGMLLTPPLSSGLLPGTLRAELLASGRAKEQVLTLADLEQAEAIWLGNSVRGLMRAEWI